MSDNQTIEQRLKELERISATLAAEFLKLQGQINDLARNQTLQVPPFDLAPSDIPMLCIGPDGPFLRIRKPIKDEDENSEQPR